MGTKRPVDTLDDNLQEAEAERHCDILGVVKAEALADPQAVIPAEGRGKALDETNSFTNEQWKPVVMKWLTTSCQIASLVSKKL